MIAVAVVSVIASVRMSATIGVLCGFAGMNLSYHLDVQSGPTIVLVATTIFG